MEFIRSRIFARWVNCDAGVDRGDVEMCVEDEGSSGATR
jgi:hypothetical protein